MPSPALFLDLITRIIGLYGDDYRSLSSLMRSFLYFLVTSSLLGTNILLSILFPNTLSLRSSLMCDQVSYP